MDIQTALEIFGLKDKEIKIYLSLLELGQATAQSISKKTGILRQTVYDTLDSLKQKGLVSETILSNVNQYSPANPEELNNIEEERKKAVKEIVPKLKERLNITQVPKIQAFFGAKGIEKIYNDTLSSKQVYWIEPYAISREIIKVYKLKNYVNRRIEKKVSIKLISDINSKQQKEWFKTNRKDLRETRFNNAIKDWESGIVIYSNKVAIYSVKDNIVGVVIDNRQIKNTFLKIFDVLWKISRIS